MNIKSLAICALTSFVGLTTASHAVTLVNGSFEDRTTVRSHWDTLGAGNTALTGWTIGGGGIDHIRDYWNASEGGQSLDMSAGSAGSISQLMTDLIIGQQYRLDFDMAANIYRGNTVKQLDVMVGSESAVYEFDFVANGATLTDQKWQTYQYFFTADRTSQLLTFTSLENNAYGAALDNVQVSAVPIPASAALLGLGLAGLGAAARRKKKAA